MLSNDVCDEMCNHALCEYDITLCFKFFDMHGYGWDFDGAISLYATSLLLFCTHSRSIVRLLRHGLHKGDALRRPVRRSLRE